MEGEGGREEVSCGDPGAGLDGVCAFVLVRCEHFVQTFKAVISRMRTISCTCWTISSSFGGLLYCFRISLIPLGTEAILDGVAFECLGFSRFGS